MDNFAFLCESINYLMKIVKIKKSLLIIIKNDGNFMLTLENGRLGASFLFNVPNVVVPPTLLLRHCPSYRPRAKL